MFENIECEWPLFFCYLIVDYCFQGNKEAVAEYTKQLEEIMIKTDDGMKLVPELYSVESANVSAEYAEPGSQNRVALGRCPFMWAQSLYILGKLLQEVSTQIYYEKYKFIKKQFFFIYDYYDRVFLLWEN